MCRVDYYEGDGEWLLKAPHSVVARKEHKCDDCFRTIAKGETYTYGAWAMDGGVFVVKLCAHCITAGRWLNKVCGGHLYPGVMEELLEHRLEEPDLRSLGLAWLCLAGQRHWSRHGQLIPVATVSRRVDQALARLPAGIAA